MEVVAGLRDLVEAEILLDLDHDLVQDDEGSDPSDASAICFASVWEQLNAMAQYAGPTKGQEVDGLIFSG